MKNNLPVIQTRFGLLTKAVGAVLAIVILGLARQTRAADEYWRTDGTVSTWTNSNWSLGSATATGGTIWTNGNNAIFSAVSTLTNVTTTDIGNVTVNANTTVIKAGTLTTAGAVRTITVADGVTLTWTNQTFSTAAGTGFIKSGNGTWDMSSESAAYPGGFTLNAGTMIVSGKNSFGTGAMSINGGTIQSSGSSAFAPSSLAIGGNFTLAGTGNDTWAMPISLSATPNITNLTASGSRILNGLISGVAGAGLNFFGTGAGQIYLGNPGNSYSGLITITGTNSAPEVGFANDGSFGAVPGSIITNAIVVDGGRLTISDTNGNAASYALNSNRGIQLGATAGTSISVPKTNGLLVYNGVIADKPGSAGILVKQGAGTLTLGGTNTYSGGTFVNNGTLQLTNGSNLLPVGTTLNLGQSGSANVGTFDLNGNNQRIAGLNSLAGTNILATAKNIITNSVATAATLIISNTFTCAYGDGSTTNSSQIIGAINLVKNGSGTQILGDTNTYSGTTTVNSGILALSGKGSIGSSLMIALASGAIIDVSARTDGTLTLTGSQTLSGFGSVTGMVVTAGSSIIAPGNPTTTGILTISSNAILNGTNILKLYKTGGTNDVLSVGGTLTYGGVLMVTNLSGTLAAGDSFKLFNAAAYLGSFSATNLPTLNAGLSWTNTLAVNGTLSVLGLPLSHLAITNLSLSGADLVIGGTNQGTGTCYVLASTNLALPKANWTAIATNVLGGDGSFTLTVTNAVNSDNPQEFFILGTTNNL